MWNPEGSNKIQNLGTPLTTTRTKAPWLGYCVRLKEPGAGAIKQKHHGLSKKMLSFCCFSSGWKVSEPNRPRQTKHSWTPETSSKNELETSDTQAATAPKGGVTQQRPQQQSKYSGWCFFLLRPRRKACSALGRNNKKALHARGQQQAKF